MARRVLPLALAAAVVATAPAAADTAARAGDAVAAVRGGVVTLRDHSIERRWSVDPPGHVRGISLRDVRTGHEWATAGPDFALTLDGAPTSSVTVWRLRAVVARRAGRRAVALRFTYALLPAAGPTLVRTFTLRTGQSVIEAQTVLHAGAALLRVGRTTLDTVTPAAAASSEVQAYHGGSDWRDDYRAISHPSAGAFDIEGEVARFGDDAGWFHVALTRGGPMFRAVRDAAGATSVTDDPARDVLDAGPLASDPPDYNRVENPAYPVPLRERLVPPGGRLVLGGAVTGVYHGGAQEAAAGFVRDLGAGLAARWRHTVDLNSFHPWNHGDGMSDQNLRAQVDRARALGVEVFMLDDQWQGGAGGESGDWNWDPARFPGAETDGIPDFADYLHSRGLRLGLWMSPAEFNSASTTYEQHPDWACAPTGDVTAQIPDDAGLGVWDLTNPGLRAHLLGVVDRLVRLDGVREFKFDFQAWVDCPPHDYRDYEDAFVSLVREMQRRHPGVTFEFDETNDQRLWPFASVLRGPSWFDNGHLHGSTAVAKLIHDVWTAAPWIPPSTLGTGLLDGTLGGGHTVDELLPIALLGHVTFWTDLTQLGAADSARVAQWLGWYRAQRARLGGPVYELTGADPLDGKTWAAFQAWDGGRGALFAFRQQAAEATRTFALHGLDPRRTYIIRSAPSGDVLRQATGAELAAGVTLALPPDGAAVWQIDPR